VSALAALVACNGSGPDNTTVFGALTPPAVATGLAPGAPGSISRRPPAQKSLLGTAASAGSRVYFTGQRGVLSEVFYPLLDTVQSMELQFFVGDRAASYLDEERLAPYEVSRPEARSMRWHAVTSQSAHGWRIGKDIFSDPDRPALVMRVNFEALGGRKVSDFNLYLSHDPTLGNAGEGDLAHTFVWQGRTLLSAVQNGQASALAISQPWVVSAGVQMVSNGFVGVSDGRSDLLGGLADFKMNWAYESAEAGNVSQLGWVDLGTSSAANLAFDVALAFGSSEAEAADTAQQVLGSDLGAMASSYDAGWREYTNGLSDQAHTADDQYFLAAMALKSVQDKSNGAMVAALGTPWGEAKPEDPPAEDKNGGYHLVWSRDLFKFANALITAGDLDTGWRAVSYLFDTLQQSVDCGEDEQSPASAECPQGYSRVGRFPQNARVNGFPNWRMTQLDEQAFPILLAHRVYETGSEAMKANVNALWPKLRATAEFILNTGPWTQQERWEETSGYSPSTIAAEIAGLVAAAEFAKLNSDIESAGRYLAAADYWQQNVGNWTFTRAGVHGNGQYYLRLNPSPRANLGTGPQRFDPSAGPDAHLVFTVGNGSGDHDQKELVDGGFLELVRLGVKSANDALVLETLPEYDAILKQSIAGKGDAWFRYNFDGYGEQNNGDAYDGSNGRGRLWPIFTAERGMYEIQRTGEAASGAAFLAALKAFATPEGFIPEQVWNNSALITGFEVTTPAPYVPGQPTKSVAPLNWAMGEYISLLASMRAGKIADVPSIVCRRYHNCVLAPAAGEVAVSLNVSAPISPGQYLYVSGSAEALGNWNTDLSLPADPASTPIWTQAINLPANAQLQYKYFRKNGDGTITWESLASGANRTLTTPASGTLNVEDVVVWSR
jgi:glucoamylase